MTALWYGLAECKRIGLASVLVVFEVGVGLGGVCPQLRHTL